MATIQEVKDGQTLGAFRGIINANDNELNSKKAEKTEVITKTNTTPFTPSQDNHPVTKIYVDTGWLSWQELYNPQSIHTDIFNRENHTGNLSPSVITEDADNRFVTDEQISNWNNKEDGIGTKGTAFNKNFGTTAGTVAAGDHSHTKADIGLSNVDNTSDDDKPVSTAQQNALNLKADADETYTETEVDNLLDDKRDLTDNEFPSAKVGNIAGGHYVEIGSTGGLTYHGNARLQKTIEIATNGVEVHPTQSPVYTNYKGSRVITFEAGSTQTFYFQAKLPHDYEPGTDLEFHVHGVFAATTTGNRRYTLTHSWANSDAVFPAASSIVQDFSTVRAADTNIIGSFGTISGAGKEPASVILCSLTRNGADAADTETGNTLIVFADFHYTANTNGESIAA